MRIAVAGSSGLIGNALVNSLRAAGHTVTRLVRREARADDEFSWDPETIGVPPESLDGVEAVVSLGGVGVGDGRWTGRFKQELRDSRITPTELLAEQHAHVFGPAGLDTTPERAREIGEAGRARILEEHTYERRGAELDRLLRDVMSAKRERSAA